MHIINAYKAGETTARHLLAGAGVEKWEMPDSGLYRNQAELYRRLPDFAIAVNMIMNVGALVEWEVKRNVEGEEPKEVDNHPLELLLRAPNPIQSGLELMQDTLGFFMIARNCYWWYNRPAPDAPPTEIWIIPPDKIQPIPNERLYLRGYAYDAGNGITIPLETWEVEHFKGFNPFNRFVGLSMVEPLAIAAQGSLASRKWNMQLFADNNARLPGILAFKDPINDVDWIKLQQDAKDNATKRQMMMLRGVGQGGVEWMQAAASQREMEFLSGLQDTKRLIWDLIAPGLSSMLDPSATEASSKTGETVFRNYAVYPVMKYLESRLNRQDRLGENIGLMQAYGDDLYIEAEDIRITDRLLELQEVESYAKVHVIDEIRKEKYGDDPIGDERGNLLLAEVKSAPFGEQGGDPQENAQNAVKPAAKADYTADLIKWREKAVKRGAGKVTPYQSDGIPADVKDAINKGLLAAKSNNDIRLLFQGHIRQARSNDASLLVSLIENALNGA